MVCFEGKVAEMYRIGMFSKLGRTTVKTLRHYDEAGLLAPAYVDEENGYRYYTTDQLFRLQEIVALRQMGFSVAEVQRMLSGDDAREVLYARAAELENALRENADKLTRLNNYISEKQEGRTMNYQVTIRDIAPCTVFSMRQVIPHYSTLFELMPCTGERVARAYPDIKCAEPDCCFIIYRDGEYKETDIDIELCQAVSCCDTLAKGCCDDDGIEFKDLPAMTIASVLHRGDYEGLRNAYAFIMKWIVDNGYTVAGEPRDRYIDGIWNRESADDWLTEVQIPVTK